MYRRSVRNERAFIARRCAPVLLWLLGFLALTPPSQAHATLWPVTAPERPGKSLRPVLRASVGSVYRRRPGRISVYFSRPRQRGRLLGRLCQESESLGWRVRRRVRDRESQNPWGRSRSDRFLG